jgi:hypothetical protein
VNLDRIASGDIVECVRRQRRFLALVDGREGATLTFTPLTFNSPYYFATSRQVHLHWARRPRRDGRLRSGAIQSEDLVAFTDGDRTVYAVVLSRSGRRLHVRAITPQATPRQLATAAVEVHYARRGRRRRPPTV